MKRDDRSCPLYGGNKPRKLEFILADALDRGADAVVTVGGAGTNHGLATLILARQVGLSVQLLLFDQPETAWVRKNLFLFEHYGARIHRLPRQAPAALAAYLKAALRRGARRPYYAPPGGTSPLSTLGYVDAALELKEQVEAGLCPEPRRIYAALGSAGTAAGLVLGLKLAGLTSRLVAVPIASGLVANGRAVLRRARSTARLADRPGGRSDARLASGAPRPFPVVEAADFEVAGGFVGPGYGALTEGARRAIGYFEEEGVCLEPTYTGKAAHALVAHAEAGTLSGGGPVLFWNTYSSVDFGDVLPTRIAEELASKGEGRFFGK